MNNNKKRTAPFCQIGSEYFYIHTVYEMFISLKILFDR